MKHYFLLLRLVLLLAWPAAAQTSGNPVLSGYHADPHIAYFAGRYYIYPTSNEGTGGQDFHAYSSVDLTNWRDDGKIFDLGPQSSWAEFNGWAPAVVARNGKYYFYYSAEAKIGVAVGSSPTGPFTDLGRPLIASDPYTADVIDPYVFVDDDGQAYLYYGGSNGRRMVVRKLNADMVSFTADAPRDITPPSYFEGPCLVKRNGVYYMSYSVGNWSDGSYRAEYATGSSPLGPWTYGGYVLSSDDRFQGPGHHSILHLPGCDEYYVAYHRYQNNDFSTRYVALDRLYFNADGSIRPVQMTSTGVAPRVPGNGCGTPSNPGAGLADGVYTLVSKVSVSGAPLRRLDVPSSRDADENKLWLYEANASNAQRWHFARQSDGYYKVTSQVGSQTRVLDAQGSGKTNGTLVQLYHSNNTAAQRWRVESDGNGYYLLTPKHVAEDAAISKKLRLDVAGAVNADRTPIHLWEDNGNDAQRWRLEAVSSTAGRVAAQAAPLAANLADESGPRLVIYPNPSPDGQARLRLSAQKAQTATVQVRNQRGRLVGRFDVPVGASSADVTLPASLGPGLYHVQTTLDGKSLHVNLRVE
ncbi:family 43 glycosylhydrolase [Hymenobacter weizhouensis]|uniref:family 43 glycosylhydrolase n=1 Tax=Hymenobacter sp. YIM 151500-1 TaxID=2987689 RepID=UPI0022272FF7|nr:family 43 glycosylhydrolase [Hymenobacter sp. YIM 151500-1]UYZ64946.1 family 43 glycosylhydrolase [Hymenobacter sp. YIM 151500-1]